ncbi:LOW QUALITY PROTEIN: uncharacterized protein ACR2FA_010452 [Aphomia sociella]
MLDQARELVARSTSKQESSLHILVTMSDEEQPEDVSQGQLLHAEYKDVVTVMSDEEQPEEGQLLHAEYKDGQLQIIEVTPFDKHDKTDTHILPDLDPQGMSPPTRYVQVINADKSVMHLDLLNMTLIKCEDDSDSYKLVANTETSSDIPSDATVTCVLQSSDTDDPDNQDAYVMVNDDQGPLVFLQSSLPQTNRNHIQYKPEKPAKKVLTPNEILERAKGLQKAKALLVQACTPTGKTRGRKRKTDLPPPHELLTSPGFKLFLYSCKMCNFKCNAIKEMTAHKALEHGAGSGGGGAGGGGSGGGGGGGGGRWRRSRAARAAVCALPVQGGTHLQLLRHAQETHCHPSSTSESKTMQVLVCGACGFESSSRFTFKKHLEDEHGTTVR